ncbi:MBOAT family O-acyltransferase [Rhodopirellula sallentina]|uniref:Membrane bound O-acyl transferase MBOAT family protein n=1 Tax=Rhodopirellula sallentina SM41 TaxID=1263870 RepID=M5UGE9_9BACT|nr:MBOAT family O-acyltransferase [Rhodopirellula sallentina]EMI56916.1 membrane bound O-acyl transferase MBOAT family protein [Rhodopirellula sallentina SM41]
MIFNSLGYAIFLAVVVIAFWSSRKQLATSRFVLLAASYVFYMSWDWRYAGLLLGSTVVDFFVGKWLDAADAKWKRKTWLTASLVCNLSVLGTFKYFNFFAETSESALAWVGAKWDLGRSQFLLPVGISFYTFQTMSYSIDIYRRRIAHEKSFLNFAVYVSFFPQLVAGPIVRAVEFLPQLHQPRTITPAIFHGGVLLICIGLIKKVVFADLLAVLLVDDVFANPRQFSLIDRWLALYGYAFQIYYDFSGYSDIAIGSAALLGFTLPLNFNRPYLATDIRDFWSRWHISLSTWLRDYLYFSLGGNRRGKLRTYVNLMLTMLLGGLWHGAAMNFVLWGGYHGGLLVIAHAFANRGNSDTKSPTSPVHWIKRWIICFHLVLLGWLLFRIESLSDLRLFFEGNTQLQMQASRIYLAVLAIASCIHFSSKIRLQSLQDWAASRCPSPVLGCLYAATILLLIAATMGTPQFIYFQF